MDLANIFAWSINFYRIQAKDSIRVLFDEIVAKNGEILGVTNVSAVKFRTSANPIMPSPMKMKLMEHNTMMKREHHETNVSAGTCKILPN